MNFLHNRFSVIFCLSAILFSSNLTAQSKISKELLTEYAETQASMIIKFPVLISVTDYLGSDDEPIGYSFTYKGGDGKLLNMLLSNNLGRTPLIRYSYSEDPENASVERAKEAALNKIGKPDYKGIYFLGFGESWHRFDNQNQSVFVNLRGPGKVLERAELVTRAEKIKASKLTKTTSEPVSEAQIKDEWERLQKGALIDPKAEHYIPNWSNTPDFDWHYGCTPTAASDMLGYYDVNYGYASLLKYFYKDYDGIQTPNQYDKTVPDIAKILKDKFGTNSSGTTVDALMGTHISQAAKEQNSNYDWGDFGLRLVGVWSKAQDEVDGGYPSVLSVDLPGDAGGHSMPLLGYGTSPDRVFIYDVVNHPGSYFFNKEDLILWNLAWIHPPLSSTGRNLKLTALRGSCYDGIAGSTQTIYTKQVKNITWDCGQSGFGKVSLYVNTNSGIGDWNKIVDLSNNPGTYGWMPDESLIGTKNRIRIRWWDNNSNIIGEDASCTDFSIAQGTFPTYTTGDYATLSFSTTGACDPSGNKWCVFAVKASSSDYTDYIDLYTDTTFAHRQVRDTIGRGMDRIFGFVGVNLGGSNPPPGPFGIQISGSGTGQIQFVECDQLDWGESSGNITWDKDVDIVKTFYLSIPDEDSQFMPASYLTLENNTSGDFVLLMYNMSNRYLGYSNYVKAADDSGNGGGEKIYMNNMASGRYLIVIWQKGSTQKGGTLSLSFKNLTALGFSGFLLNKPDSVRYSGTIGALPKSVSPWAVIGVIPDSSSVWEIRAAKNRLLSDSLITSFSLFQNVSLLAIKRPPALAKMALNDSIFIKMNRVKGFGPARFEINDYIQEAPFHDGDNPVRLWPAGRRFHIVPFQSAVSIKELVVLTESVNGPKVFCGIAPDLPRPIFNATMLWGSPGAAPESALDVKTGAVVLWTLVPPLQPFNYKIKTKPLTGIYSPEYIPREFSLSQNYPNPLNPSTRIDYELPSAAFVTLDVYDLLGKKVISLVDEYKSAGKHTVDFNARGLSSGVYYYVINANGFIKTRKMILLK